MKKKDFENALGALDERFASESAPRKSKGNKKKWFCSVGAVAACLALAITGVSIFGGGNAPAKDNPSTKLPNPFVLTDEGEADAPFPSTKIPNPFVLTVNATCEAKYPEMAEYPGDDMSPGFEERHLAWWESKRAQNAYLGYGENLDSFFQKTISEFLRSEKGEDRTFSPLNVYMALSMLAEITDGDTRSEILDLIGADDIESLRTQAHAVWNANYSDDGAVTSILGSSLWLSDDTPLCEETLKTLAENYYASTYSGEMGSEEYSATFRKWLSDQTGGLLDDSIKDIELSPETIFAMATTIYFRAKWENEFSPEKTKKEIFHGVAGDTKRDFMHATEFYGQLYTGKKFMATSKSLENTGYMMFVLPDEGVSIDELLSDKEALEFMTSNGDWKQSKSLKVNLSLPKFDVSSSFDLCSGLHKLGVSDVFSVDADFSPLAGDADGIYLSEIKHGARTMIDEEGVTAAAYTEMQLCGSAMPPEDEIDFVLDRPFIFLVVGTDGLPLFAGTVNN